VAAKPNASILSFFKKTDEDALFVGDVLGGGIKQTSNKFEVVETLKHEDQSHDGSDVHEGSRFNETGGAVKRRKTKSSELGDDDAGIASHEDLDAEFTRARSLPGKATGPFVEDSDSEDDNEDSVASPATAVLSRTTRPTGLPSIASDAPIKPEPIEVDRQQPITAPPKPPPLIHEATSVSIPLGEDDGPDDQFADFEGLHDDFDEDLFEDGEEYVERKYLEEQRQLETDESASCPICSASLDGVSESDASTHVNNCLDGNPTPLPEKKEPTTPISDGAARFKRPPRPPKPGQENPFSSGASTGGSAFSKLMSSHAEDAAWAAASAAEQASRGKPAYTRTCPFYKIMPGFNICVDAFRYGAVKGCNAYFLSHFHSDHYIGLTSTWTHGPIYCSKVTANLVKQQLRVDPQYVISMDWETPTEIPGTNGVVTTMIPANHCPGSSLYLFEKKLSGHSAAKPKSHRVLHCGDFRACPAHLEHPLLMPDIVDSLTKKSRQQKIDVCYLDTTYLNPKYAFPSQTQVIQACADMCVSLNKVAPDLTDGWETMKRSRAGEGMVKFVRKDSAPSPTIKVEPTDDVKVMPNGKLGSEKTRGRLLVVVGTYSIGKERICLGIARALDSRIYAPPAKMRIVHALEDPELLALMTKNPREAQVHMTPLFEIRADTLDEYLAEYSDSFTRCVGFRPSGWQYRPPNSRFVESPAVQTVLHSPNWRSTFSMKELVPQRGSTSRASCFGVPYSEHSSFRELTMFCCALRIEKIVPTVNVGSAKSREKMGVWIERWLTERRKNGLFKLGEGGGEW